MQQGGWLQTLLPFAIIAFVMWRRWKTIGTPRPLRPGRMWIMPIVLSTVVGVMLLAMPPGPSGWGLFAMGFVIGFGVGWQRARLMRLHLDETSGQLMVRQSPMAFLFILVLFFARRLLVPAQSAQAASHAGPPALPLVTDALLGFALGMVIGTQVELWLRAKALKATG